MDRLFSEIKRSPIGTIGAICSLLAVSQVFGWPLDIPVDSQPLAQIGGAMLIIGAWCYLVGYFLRIPTFERRDLKLIFASFLLFPAGFYFGYQSDIWFNSGFNSEFPLSILLFVIRSIYVMFFSLIYVALIGELGFRPLFDDQDSGDQFQLSVMLMLFFSFILSAVLGFMYEKNTF